MGSRSRKEKRRRVAAKAVSGQAQPAKIEDGRQQADMAEIADDPDSQLAGDFMFGWDTKNESDRQAFGLAAANGQMDPDALAEFRSLSLLRGFEELDMMMACADALLRKDADPRSIDGQDVLTYVAKLLGRISQESGPGLLSNKQLEAGLAQQETSNISGGDGKKGKRKRGKESPYFAEDGTSESVAKKIAKKARKKAKRQAKGSALAEQLEPDDVSLAAQHSATTLQDSATWYSSSRNSKYEEAAQDKDLVQDNDAAQDTKHGQGLTTGRATKDHGSVDDHPIVGDEEPTSDFEAQSKEFDCAVDSQSPPPKTYNGVEPVRNDDETTEPAPLQATQVGNELLPNIDEPPRRMLRSSIGTSKRTNSSKFFEPSPKAPSPAKIKSPRPPRGTVSALPFPTLSAPRFGLVQEELAGDPFRLLVAVTFLVKTSGKAAIPVFRTLMEKFPSPGALAGAKAGEISAMIKHLGLSVVRTAQIQKFARIWLDKPPTGDVRYGVKNYPRPGDGSDIRAGEELPPEERDDSRTSAWEIGHMTQGPYAIDSWRIFCRDVLLGRAQDWKGKGREGEFQPEWMRVLPQDKELRAYLRWMWMLEGWAWEPATGDKEVLSEELRSAVNEGRVAWDNTGNLKVLKKEEGDAEEEKADQSVPQMAVSE
ncbi:hypothetical protein PG990_006095 [Apiospora arundinis]|uniref:DNA glycosylase n=1 Tax=Apiospora arundinis TaxID=335852 RepID=A0ABR2J9P1_9PEZI